MGTISRSRICDRRICRCIATRLVGSETIDGHDVFVVEATPTTEREAADSG